MTKFSETFCNKCGYTYPHCTCKQINMVKCAYCDEEYVIEEDIFCHKCELKVQAEISIVALSNEATTLKNISPKILKKYKHHIFTVIQQLQQVVEKL